MLERVAAYAAGPLGREAVLARRPSDDVAWIAGELQTVAELARLIRDNRGITAEPVPEIDSALSRLRVGGSVLEGSQLLAIRRTLVAARLVVAELKRVAPDAPRTALYQRPLPDKSLERRLTLAFDDDGQLLDSASPYSCRGAPGNPRRARAAGPEARCDAPPSGWGRGRHAARRAAM